MKTDVTSGRGRSSLVGYRRGNYRWVSAGHGFRAWGWGSWEERVPLPPRRPIWVRRLASVARRSGWAWRLTPWPLVWEPSGAPPDALIPEPIGPCHHRHPRLSHRVGECRRRRRRQRSRSAAHAVPAGFGQPIPPDPYDHRVLARSSRRSSRSDPLLPRRRLVEV